MDRQTYIQLDRIESKMDEQIFRLDKVAKDALDRTLELFYEEIIQNPEGELHHLTKDPLVTKYFEEEDEPEFTTDEGLPEEKEEYSQ